MDSKLAEEEGILVADIPVEDTLVLEGIVVGTLVEDKLPVAGSWDHMVEVLDEE